MGLLEVWPCHLLPPPLSLLWSTAVWELAVPGVLWLWLLPSY